MSFLHGVLESVKDDDNVTTYDKYIDNKDHQLQKLLDSLQSSIGQGRSVFGERVEEVNGRTLSVINALGELITDKIDSYATNVLSGHPSKELQQQLREWTSVLGSINDHIKSNIITNVSKLDPALSDKITREIEPVRKVVAQLRGVATDPHFTGHPEFVDTTLEKQRINVETKIVNESRELKRKLRTQLENILSKIDSLRTIRTNHFVYLKKAVKAAKADAEKLVERFNEDYKIQIIQRIIRLKDGMTEIYRGESGKCPLENDVEAINTKLGDINSKLGKYVSKLSDSMHKTGVVVDSVKTLVNKITGFANDHQGSWKANMKELSDDIKQKADDLSNDFSKAKNHVKQFVDEAQLKVKELDEKVMKDLEGLKENIHNNVHSYFQTQLSAVIEGIKAAAIGGTKGVDKLLNDMKKYSAVKGLLTAAKKDTSFANALEYALKSLKTNLNNQLPSNGKQNKLINALSDDINGRVDGAFPSQGYVGDSLDLFQKMKDFSAAKNNIANAISDVNKHGLETFDGNLGTSYVSPLKTLSTNITKNVDDLSKTVWQTTQHINAYLKDLKDVKIGERIAAIRQNIDILQSATLSSVIGDDITTVLAKIEKLEDLPEAVEDAKSMALQKMDHLDDAIKQIKNNIEIVDTLVTDADAALVRAIDDTQQALIEVNETARQAVSQLQENIINKVSEAFTFVRSAVRSLFSTSHAADLQALRALVDQQLREVQKIVDADAVTGVKGMLNKMNELFKGKYLNPDELKKPVEPRMFNTVSLEFKEIADCLLQYVESQVKTPNEDPKQAATPNTESNKVNDIQGKLDKLLDYLKRITFDELKRPYNFDHNSDELLENLKTSVTNLTSSNFHGFHNPLLLDALKSGMDKFTAELSRAYVNRYSGCKPVTEWERDEKDPQTQELKKVLSTEGRNCAKVCLTILETMNHDLDILKKYCVDKWYSKQIYAASSLGSFLHKCGYGVASLDSRQDNELDKNVSGGKITTLLIRDHNHVYNKQEDTKNALQIIFKDHLRNYYEVCHIATSFAKKTPCNVYEMLCWLTALPHHPVYIDLLSDGFDDLFDKVEKTDAAESDADGPSFTSLEDLSLKAYPRNITHSDLHDAITHITYMAPTLLTTVLGTGDAETTYAVEFHSNILNLTYPSRAVDCLHTFLDILRRLLPVLKFVYGQCGVAAKEYGWANCLYGKDISTTKSQCTNHSKCKANDQPSSQPTCQANTKPICQPTSPLMSYLTDSLPGHLPHQVTSVGCTSKCSTCPGSKPGMPCLTPLGFRGFSGSTKSGRDLCDILNKFLDYTELRSPLCMVPIPPKTLPEHFDFALSLVKGWHHSKMSTTSSIKQHVVSSIKRLSIDLYNEPSKLTDALRDAYRSRHYQYDDKSHRPLYADVSSLAMTPACNDPVGKPLCAPYLSSICSDTYYYLAQKHSNLYLNWAIYLPWTFWNLLNNLYNAFCGITCADWGCRGCLRGDKCRSGKHGVVEDEKQDAICQCHSVVECKGVSSTFYQYGFSFGEASTLNGETPKKCSDFCSQLRNVLHSEYFQKLFEECDNFLKAIRWPFMLTLLALWSLSLLYLLHIAVVRLDVLRIRSHLRSPASHRIAAQSLLAVAKVGKIANVKYFSP
ncbi:hypothetical protein, conserved [Babesia ovata]|uniref:C3H1-type domain-containing protein n=1 Tax=Babesia ovata TaxID=189622 RepID=A0A2H6KIW4_9APIC|nr:uncharacterized protein BOVATA_044280 [Babesia ovata]GBE62935.1 hypothetical protein, conserved [Babesia ovata]